VAAPAPPPQRLQAPSVDVPVPANAPEAAGAPRILVAPPAGSGWGTPGPAGGGTPGGAPSGPDAGSGRPAPLPPAPVLTPAVPLHPGPFNVQRRSLADMANAQLRRGKPRDPLAEGMEGAAVDDCLHSPAATPAVGGLLAAPGLAARALSGRCAK
jgi:hypothetical protein